MSKICSLAARKEPSPFEKCPLVQIPYYRLCRMGGCAAYERMVTVGLPTNSFSSAAWNILVRQLTALKAFHQRFAK